MRTFGKWLGRFILLLALLAVGLWIFGPYEPVELDAAFNEGQLGEDLDAYLAAREAAFDDIRPGAEKRILWAEGPGARTDWVVLYVHGFTATSEEIRPVPDNVATALGANLVFTRLQGHGRTGAAMTEASAAGWMLDVGEALAVARAAGERVVVISTSTGGTLVAAHAQQAGMLPGIAGLVFVSPNFGINDPLAGMLTWPAARYWVPLVAGDVENSRPDVPGYDAHWTFAYPSAAIMPMAALVRVVRALDFSTALTPALFLFSDDDQVVDPAATSAIMAAWGGPVSRIAPQLGPEDDPAAHVIAGDILSPSQTAPAVDAILDWVRGL